MQVLTGLGNLGSPGQRGVALADQGPIKGRDVATGAGLDSLCSEQGGRAAADAVNGDPRVVGVSGFMGAIDVLTCDEFGDCGTGAVQISHHTDSSATDVADLPVVYRFAP